MTAPLHCEFPVVEDTAMQVARAVTRYRLSSVSFVVPAVVLVALVLVFALGGVVWLAVVVALGLAAVVLSAVLRLPRLAAQLQARGFRPGTTIAVDYAETSFVVTTDGSHATHDYGDVKSVRLVGGVAAIKLARAGYLVVLPTALFPDEARRRLVPAAH